MEVKWNLQGNYIATGSRDGNCILWEFKHDRHPQMLINFQASKTLNRKKKRTFACNFICWNCTYTHFSIGYHEIVEEDDSDRGHGDLLVYSVVEKKITCEFSKEISVPLSAIKAMDSHPNYPNIILICEANGRIILFDIFLKCIVNIFEERGFHILHPQFNLIPGDCKFSQDGFSFLVST